MDTNISETPEKRRKTGDVDSLSSMIQYKLNNNNEYTDYRKVIEEKYNWDKIAKQTLKVYKELLN